MHFKHFFSPLNGFFNAIVYGLNDELREKIRGSCINIFTTYGEFIKIKLPSTDTAWKKEYDEAPERIPEYNYDEEEDNEEEIKLKRSIN